MRSRLLAVGYWLLAVGQRLKANSQKPPFTYFPNHFTKNQTPAAKLTYLCSPFSKTGSNQ
jgi:hypothetical protein